MTAMRRTYPNPYQGQYNTAGNMTATSNGSGMSTNTTQEMMEQENDHLVDSLKHKVSALRSLSIDIGEEVRGQNTFLKDMDKDFDNTGGLLSGSMKRLKGLSSAGHNRWMCYMIILIIIVFIILYYVVRWR